jgi:hypothetical protein
MSALLQSYLQQDALQLRLDIVRSECEMPWVDWAPGGKREDLSSHVAQMNLNPFLQRYARCSGSP